MTLVFEDRAAALEALQPQKSWGENDALLEDTAPALHACCQGHPMVADCQRCGRDSDDAAEASDDEDRTCSGAEKKHRSVTNWGLPMLVQDKVVLLCVTSTTCTFVS